MMKLSRASLLLCLVGCSSAPAVVDAGADAAEGIDAYVDAARVDAAPDVDANDEADAGDPDAGDADAGDPDGGDPDTGIDAASCPRPLLLGGVDLGEQGWITVMRPPATVTYGADYVELATSTTGGASVGGQLLATLPGAIAPGAPFRLEVVMQLIGVDTHNSFDAAAAILGSFAPPYGSSVDRAEMIYLDAAAIGWADDSASSTISTIDGGYHSYVLSVDESGAATVTVDGAAALTRAGYTTNGTIAVGDQTNEPNLDATMRIRSVSLLCPE